MHRSSAQFLQRQRLHLWRSLLLFPVLLALWSCGVDPVIDTQGDGAPQDIDVSTIPDPVPRHEPYSRYGNPATYTVAGRTYSVMNNSSGYVERGVASWYGTKFHGRRTSSGEPYDVYGMTAAHKTLPIPCYAQVTNLSNGRSVIVRINDRGPFVDNRIIDLSYAAARKLGIVASGTGLVEVRTIDARAPAAASGAAIDAGATGANRLFVQVGAFSDRSNAERLRERLRRVPLEPVQIQELSTPQQPLYRVRLGPLDNVSEADRMTEKLAQLGLSNARIVVD